MPCRRAIALCAILSNAAEAYRVYAKSAADQNLAASIKLRAAAKGGTMLDADPELSRR